MKNSICLYCSFSNLKTITGYIRVYLTELDKHFSKLVLVTNKRQLNAESVNWLSEMHIDVLYVDNEGYDYGMWYKTMLKYDCSVYDRVVLVNDSCILFRNLDKEFNWIDLHDYDYCGIVSSNMTAYHIQSFFAIMNHKAFLLLFSYLKANGFINDYRKVIKIYEVGISQYLIKQGLKVGAVYDDITHSLTTNPTFPILPALIEAGLPLIKKKIVFRRYRPGELWGLMLMNRDIDEQRYIEMIKKANAAPLLLDLNETLKEQHIGNAVVYKRFYKFCMQVAQFFKQIKAVRLFYHFLIHIKHMLEGRSKEDF